MTIRNLDLLIYVGGYFDDPKINTTKAQKTIKAAGD